MDPRDVSWIDEQMSEDESTQHPPIREAKVSRRKARPAGATGLIGARTLDIDNPLEVVRDLVPINLPSSSTSLVVLLSFSTYTIVITAAYLVCSSLLPSLDFPASFHEMTQ